MNLQNINDSLSQGTFVVGNLNDYVNLINRTNTYEKSQVTVDDLRELESEHMGETLSYRITGTPIENVIKTYEIYSGYYLNIV